MPIRFIPARAGNTCRNAWQSRSPSVHPRAGGNTCSAVSVSATPSVHPRAGGEHKRARGCGVGDTGSSPRGRGTHRLDPLLHGVRRFIPARAGNTALQTSILSSASVHPRAGGEHAKYSNASGSKTGSSPRGRGTLIRICRDHLDDRFIPRGRGTRRRPPSTGRPTPVHPRAGGEHGGALRELTATVGSSPRGRGTRVHRG